MTYPPNGDGNQGDNRPQNPPTGGTPSQDSYGQPQPGQQWGQPAGYDQSAGQYSDPTAGQQYGQQGSYGQGGQYSDQQYGSAPYGANPTTGSQPAPATGSQPVTDNQPTSVYGQQGGYDQGGQYGSTQYGAPAYGDQQYGQQDTTQYGAAGYGDQQYGQQGGYDANAAQYGAPAYGDQQYGQQGGYDANAAQYGAPAYGQQQGGAPWGGEQPKKSNKGLIAGIAAGAVLLLGGLGTWLALGPLSKTVLDKDQVATDVAAQYQSETGNKLENVTCNDELVVKKNTTYTCKAKDENGDDVNVVLDLTDDEGAYTWMVQKP